MIELIQAAFAGLLWLLGTAAVLLVALLVPPVRVWAAVDSLYADEEAPIDWEAVSFRAQLSGVLGALHVHLERRGRNMQVAWRFFGISKPVRRKGERNDRQANKGDGPADGSAGPSSRPGSKGAKKTKRRRTSPVNLFALRRLLPEAQWLLRTARRRLKFRVRGRVVYGFSDPFATGLVHGLTASLRPLPDLVLQPDYAQGKLEGSIEFGLRVYPLEALFIVVHACFRPGVRSLWWPRVRDALRIKLNRTKEAH